MAGGPGLRRVGGGAGLLDGTGRVVAPGKRRRHKSGYIAGLDGWRAIAIAAVLMAHDDPWSLFGHSNAAWHVYGGWGVWLFFAISGFLVCGRILADEASAGSFRIKDFYIRRFFRIQPAAMAYLAVIGLLSVLGIAHQRLSSWLGSVFLYQNYLFHYANTAGDWVLSGHFWTLAVEEHFYLVLSALLLFFRRGRVAVFSVVIALLLVWDWVGPRLVPYKPLDAARYSEFNLQYLLLAALFALLLRQDRVRQEVTRVLRPWLAFALTAAGLLLSNLRHGGWHHLSTAFAPGHRFVWYYTFPLWVVATSLHPESWTTRALEIAPLKYLGRLSYSVYLWHVLFFLGGYPPLGVHARWLLVLTERPWRYVATAVAACLSFYLVERPTQRLGHSLAPPATPGHSDLRETPAPPTAAPVNA